MQGLKVGLSPARSAPDPAKEGKFMQTHLMLARYAMLKGDLAAEARRRAGRVVLRRPGRPRYAPLIGVGVSAVALAAVAAAANLAAPGLL